MPISSFKGSELARTRSRVATATRLGKPEEIAEARREHAASKIANCIARTLDSAPLLTHEQIDELAGLLRGDG